MRSKSIAAINGVVGNANITGPTLDFREIYRISGQVVVGAGAATAGSLQLQYSNDPVDQVNFNPDGTITGVVNWSNFGTAATIAGAGLHSLLFATLPYADIGFTWVRALYTDTSGGTGAGAITVNLNIQGF